MPWECQQDKNSFKKKQYSTIFWFFVRWFCGKLTCFDWWTNRNCDCTENNPIDGKFHGKSLSSRDHKFRRRFFLRNGGYGLAVAFPSNVPLSIWYVVMMMIAQFQRTHSANSMKCTQTGITQCLWMCTVRFNR